MEEELNFVAISVFIGIGATLIMDLWGMFQRRVLGITSLNYAMVGRWIGHLPKGRFIHENIGNAAPVNGELILGWSAHYLIGVIFAGMLLVLCGLDWASDPTFTPAFLFGVFSVVAPFFILQPGIGAGFAASKTPNPNLARLRSLTTHCSFGVGLYISAMIWAFINLMSL